MTVTESDTGFNVGNEQYETDVASTDSPVIQETADTASHGEATVAEKLARLKAKAEEQMGETIPYLSDAYTTDELYKTMIAGGKRITARSWNGNPSKTICRMLKAKKYYVHCVSSLTPRWPKAAA